VTKPIAQQRATPQQVEEWAAKARGTPGYCEQLVLDELSRRGEDSLEFQYVVHPFYVDFCHVPSKTVFEIDGSVHADYVRHDWGRTQMLSKAGYTVHRFTNKEVVENVGAVVDRMMSIIAPSDTT